MRLGRHLQLKRERFVDESRTTKAHTDTRHVLQNRHVPHAPAGHACFVAAAFVMNSSMSSTEMRSRISRFEMVRIPSHPLTAVDHDDAVRQLTTVT